MMSGRRMNRVLTGFRLVAVALMASLIVVLPEAPSHASGITNVRQLRNAPIPASCGHPATRLNGYTKNFGTRGNASLRVGFAKFGRLRGVTGAVALVPLDCSVSDVAGKPEFILLYGSGPRLLGYVNLAKIPGTPADAAVDGRQFRNGSALVHWTGGVYVAGYARTTYRGVIGWSHGRMTWSYTGPLTADYAVNRNSDNSGPGIVNSPSDVRTLAPAPQAFRNFIKQRWNRMNNAPAAKDCAQPPSINVDRYSHKGFAVGGENDCGGAIFVWGVVRGRWAPIWESQQPPQCSQLTALQRRAFVALGQQCWVTNGQPTKTLGNWPTSGE